MVGVVCYFSFCSWLVYSNLNFHIVCLWVVQNCHRFLELTQRMLGGGLYAFKKMSFMGHCNFEKGPRNPHFKVLFW